MSNNNDLEYRRSATGKVLKRVRFDIDEKDQVTGVSTISIVGSPAIGSDFVVMSKRNSLRWKKVELYKKRNS